MIAFLEEMMAKLFGLRAAQPVPVCREEERPVDRMFKGRR